MYLSVSSFRSTALIISSVCAAETDGSSSTSANDSRMTHLLASGRVYPGHAFHQLLGLNAFTTLSLVVRVGPPMRSMQYGTAGMTASRHSRIAAGLPGRFTMSDLPRIPAVWRDRIAVGTDRS